MEHDFLPHLLPDSRRPAILHLLELVRSAGGRALLVGGCVRDALLGRPSKDIDIEVYGLEADVLRPLLASHYRLDEVGASFGVIKLHGLDVDVALPRSETRLGAGHRDFAVATDPHLSYAEAAARRDLTINAILCDPLTGELIDPWHGQGDLRRRVLRHVSPHFTEDPLRVLRLMQFVARLEFQVAPETVELCRTLSQDSLPRERLGDEWEKLLLKGQRPSLGLRFLRDCGWTRFYPELEATIGCQQTPLWHPEGDVWEHTLKALDIAATLRHGDRHDDLALMAAVLCHDFGKPRASYTDADGIIRSPGHDIQGLAPARDFLRRLWLNNDLEKLVLALVACHMRAMDVIRNGNDRTMRRLSLDALRLDLLADVFEADLRASRPQPTTPVDQFRAMAERLRIARSTPKPLILGRHLLERGLKPGPELGRITRLCFEHQLDGDFDDLPGALHFLDHLLQNPPPHKDK